ncbi:MAG: hypothetical protein M1470_08905 [Bacteroidetes bacterium]|nr:hypothetical protein [Bacteroidota bacterium]
MQHISSAKSTSPLRQRYSSLLLEFAVLVFIPNNVHTLIYHIGYTASTDPFQRAPTADNKRLNLTARSSAALRGKGHWRGKLAGALCAKKYRQEVTQWMTKII